MKVVEKKEAHIVCPVHCFPVSLKGFKDAAYVYAVITHLAIHWTEFNHILCWRRLHKYGTNVPELLSYAYIS
jgi:hypothetical protein